MRSIILSRVLPHLGRIINYIASLFLTTVVILYLGLIRLGQWQGDEYADFASLARSGWYFLVGRLRWSPRPASELLFFFYGWMVNHLHRPMTVFFLGTLWTGLIAAGLLTVWQSRNNRPAEDALPELLVALALLASFLTAGELTEVFYWPAGAVAYLPTLSATLLLFLQVARGRLAKSSGRSLCSFCLIIAACSSETGATFVLSYALIQTTCSVILVIRRSCSPEGRTTVLWWLVPAVISILVLVTFRLNRYYVVEEHWISASPALGHPLASLVAASRQLLLEVLGRSSYSRAWFGLGTRLPSELLLMFGIVLCWSRFGRLSKATFCQVAALAAAFMMASVLVLAAAYLHFGSVGGQRHQLIRQCWILMSIAGTAIVALSTSAKQRLRLQTVPLAVASILLCTAVNLVWHKRELFAEYRVYKVAAQTIDQNFQSGFCPSDNEMVFVLPPRRAVIFVEQIEPGTYTQASRDTTYAHHVLKFFNKQRLVVRNASPGSSAAPLKYCGSLP